MCGLKLKAWGTRDLQSILFVHTIKLWPCQPLSFLAQFMKETVWFNDWDEKLWDPIMANILDTIPVISLASHIKITSAQKVKLTWYVSLKYEIEITKNTNTKWYGDPAPLFCRPKTKYPFTEIWDYTKECNKHWAHMEGCCSRGCSVNQTMVSIYEIFYCTPLQSTSMRKSSKSE